MTESPRPTEEEQEQGPDRIQDEEEMRGSNVADPESPAADEDDED
ncbi:MAG TPA: hypothetical protein VNI55_09845 [Gaiellaceae bacterium]|nr:hypothetical protein [Gaiellaceae bacterium]